MHVTKMYFVLWGYRYQLPCYIFGRTCPPSHPHPRPEIDTIDTLHPMQLFRCQHSEISLVREGATSVAGMFRSFTRR